jgi:hypothetical protein
MRGHAMTELARPTHLLDELTANGGLRSTSITYEQLEAIGVMLKDGRKKIQWAMGEWLIVVEERFPEQFSQAAELLELSETGLMEYIRVASRVPRSVRREDLSWSHHRAVASLEPPEQREWLAKAATLRWSHHELRQAMKPAELEPVRVCGECGRAL